MTETDDSPRAKQPLTPGRLSLSERFMRTLTLSAYVRMLAWQGARRRASGQGESAVVDRFLTQLYGAEVAMSFRAARDRQCD